MPVPFKEGNKVAKGGKREGAGRPPDWLHEKARNIIDKNKLIEWLGEVGRGALVGEQLIFDNKKKKYKKVKIQADIKERERAIEILLEATGDMKRNIDISDNRKLEEIRERITLSKRSDQQKQEILGILDNECNAH